MIMDKELRSSRWIRKFHPSLKTTAPQLLFLPHAGGSASYFHSFSQVLSADAEVLIAQYPGRQERFREAHISDIPALAEQLVAALVPLLIPGRPLALFGHSMGALVGYELALRLASEDIPVSVLFASGRSAPSTPLARELHTLPEPQLIEVIRSMDGTAAELFDHPEISAMILPTLRADFKAVETYRDAPARFLACPVVSIIGSEDDQVSHAQASAWQKHTTAEHHVHVLPGGHFYLAEDKQQQEVIHIMRQYLANLGAGSSSPSPESLTEVGP